MTDWTETANKVLGRWGAKSDHLWSEEGAGRLLGISVGLGAIYNDDVAAERHWMTQYHHGLKETPLNAVLRGRVETVLNLVNSERHL